MELADRHFDQGLTATELEEFSQQLLNDKDSARAFAQAARLEYSLEANVNNAAKESDLSQLIALLEEEPETKKTARPLVIVTGIAAALALFCGVFLLWPSDEPNEPLAAVETKQREVRIQRPSIHLDQKPILTAIIPKKKESPSEAEARIRKRLSRYYLPQTDIDNLPLNEALTALQATFYSVDQLGWGDSEAIAFKVADEDGDTPSVSLRRSNISALSALHLLAIQSGHELSFAPPEILFKKKQGEAIEEDDGELSTRSFFADYKRLGTGPYRENLITPLGEVPLVGYLSPEGQPRHPNDSENSDDVTSFLRDAWGLQLSSDGASATLIEGDHLVLKSTSSDLELFASLHAEATGGNRNSSPVKISMRIFSVPSELVDGGDRIIDFGELQRITQQWNQQTGVDLLTTPTSITQVEHEVRVDMLSYPESANLDAASVAASPSAKAESVVADPGSTPSVSVKFVERPLGTGFLIPVTAHAAGEQITLVGQIDQAINEEDLSAEQLEPFGGSDPDSPIVHFITDFEAPLLPGQVALFECESPEPDKKHIIAVSADWVGEIETSFVEEPEE